MPADQSRSIGHHHDVSAMVPRGFEWGRSRCPPGLPDSCVSVVFTGFVVDEVSDAGLGQGGVVDGVPVFRCSKLLIATTSDGLVRVRVALAKALFRPQNSQL